MDRCVQVIELLKFNDRISIVSQWNPHDEPTLIRHHLWWPLQRGRKKNFFDFETIFLSVRSFWVRKFKFDLRRTVRKRGGGNKSCCLKKGMNSCFWMAIVELAIKVLRAMYRRSRSVLGMSYQVCPNSEKTPTYLTCIYTFWKFEQKRFGEKQNWKIFSEFSYKFEKHAPVCVLKHRSLLLQFCSSYSKQK